MTAIYATLPVEERVVALNTLASRVSYARSLIAAVGAGTIPARDLTASTLRQLTFLKDEAIKGAAQGAANKVRRGLGGLIRRP